MRFSTKVFTTFLAYRRAQVQTANALGLALGILVAYHEDLSKVDWVGLPKDEVMRVLMRKVDSQDSQESPVGQRCRMDEAAWLRTNIMRGTLKVGPLQPVAVATEWLTSMWAQADQLSTPSAHAVERRTKILDKQREFPVEVPVDWLSKYSYGQD
jgi:hypothetical protein